MDASREQFTRQTGRPILSLEAVRPRPSVPSPLRANCISQGLRPKLFRKSELALGENPRGLRSAPCSRVSLDCRVQTEEKERS